jgi:hypothetical protein
LLPQDYCAAGGRLGSGRFKTFNFCKPFQIRCLPFNAAVLRHFLMIAKAQRPAVSTFKNHR